MPAMWAVPDVGFESVVRILTVVVLPAPLGSEKGEDLAGLDFERDAVEGLDLARVHLDELVGGDGDHAIRGSLPFGVGSSWFVRYLSY